MKKRIFTSAIACVAAMSLSVAAFAAVDPGATNGSVNASQDITQDTEIEIKSELGLEIAAPAGTFAENVTKVVLDAEVNEADATVADTAAKSVADAITKIDSTITTEVAVNTKLAITLKDQDGNAIQPTEGKSVTVTVAYDGVSNIIVYIGDDGKVEFIKLVVSGNTASFEASHFSDYYMAKVDESVVASLEGKSADNSSAGNTDNKPDDDKNVSSGVVLAIIPAAVAAAAVVVSKKRK